MRIPSRKTLIKQVAAVLIIGGTIAIFIWYLASHPDVVKVVLSLHPIVILAIILGYVLITVTNAFILTHSLRLIGKTIRYSENFLLTGYSSIVNFFGPLQSGPGVRAIYLKTRHKVKLRDFLKTTLIFYGFFALINSAILFGIVPFHFGGVTTGLLVITSGIVVLGCLVFLFRKVQFMQRVRELIQTDNKDFWLIGFGALLITLLTTAIYYIELLQVGSAANLGQTIIYTAAANLALFVSLTPGAIGIRESFLFLSQQLHGIGTDFIVAASVIDRAVYLGFLGLLFLGLLLLGGKKLLSLRRTTSQGSE